jgi:hypothetical protein
MVKKRQHCLDSDVVQFEVRHRAADAVREKQEEDAETVPVGTYRMFAGSADPAEMISEETLDEREQGVGLGLRHGPLLLLA